MSPCSKASRSASVWMFIWDHLEQRVSSCWHLHHVVDTSGCQVLIIHRDRLFVSGGCGDDDRADMLCYALSWGQLERDRRCGNCSGVLTVAGIATSRQRWAIDQWNKLVLCRSELSFLCSASAAQRHRLQPLRHSAWTQNRLKNLLNIDESACSLCCQVLYSLHIHLCKE